MTAVRGSHRDWLEHHAGIRCFIWFKPSPLVASGTTTSVIQWGAPGAKNHIYLVWSEVSFGLGCLGVHEDVGGVFLVVVFWGLEKAKWLLWLHDFRTQERWTHECKVSEVFSDSRVWRQKKCLFDLVFLDNIHVKQFWSPDSWDRLCDIVLVILKFLLLVASTKEVSDPKGVWNMAYVDITSGRPQLTCFWIIVLRKTQIRLMSH